MLLYSTKLENHRNFNKWITSLIKVITRRIKDNNNTEITNKLRGNLGKQTITKKQRQKMTNGKKNNNTKLE
jgi:hypothetical protein